MILLKIVVNNALIHLNRSVYIILNIKIWKIMKKLFYQIYWEHKSRFCALNKKNQKCKKQWFCI